MLEYANHDPDWPSESSALWAAAAVSRGGLAPLEEDEAKDMIAVAAWVLERDGEELSRRAGGGASSGDTQAWYGNYLVATGDDGGQRLLERLGERGDAQALMFLGNHLRDQGHPLEALAAFKRGFEVSGNGSFATNAAFVIRDLRGDLAAVPWMRKAADAGDRLAVLWLRSTHRDQKDRRRRSHSRG